MKLHVYFMRLLCLLSCVAISWAMSAQVPEGYYDDAIGKRDTLLKTALHQIIEVGTRLSYGSGAESTWTGFEKADLHPDGYVWDMYSLNKVKFPGNGKAPSGMNIEHSFAKSWWGGTKNNAYKDLYHLNPSNSMANSERGSFPLGVVDGDGSFNNGSLKVGKNCYGTSYSGQCFEPLDEYKGDFARAYFYMVTCYEDFNWSTGNSNSLAVINPADKYRVFKPWFAQMLLEWHRTDPVSEKEINRQKAIYELQHNRNPFIDYPCLVEYIWGDKVGEAVDFDMLMSTSSDEYLSSDDKSGCDCRITVPTVTAPRKNTTVAVGAANIGQTVSVEVLVQGVLLTRPLALQVLGQDAGCFSLSQTEIAADDALAGTMLQITYRPEALGNHQATLAISSAELQAATEVVLTGECLAALTAPAVDELLLNSTDATETQETIIELRGTNLQSPVRLALSGQDAAHFSLSANMVQPAEAMDGTQITLSYRPQEIGAHTAVLQITSPDFSTKTINLVAHCSFEVYDPVDVTEESFRASWSNADVADYILDVYTKQVTGVEMDTVFSVSPLSTSAVAESSYLNTTGKVYDETDALRLGTGSGDGTLNISGVDFSAGGMIYITAQRYRDDESVLKVTQGAVVLASYELSGEYRTYEVVVPEGTSGVISVQQGNKDERINIASITAVTGGEKISNVSLAGYPKHTGNVLSAVVEGLSPQYVYYYTVTPEGLAESEEIEVLLLGNDMAVVTPENNLISYYVMDDVLHVSGLSANARLALYDVSGRVLHVAEAHGTVEIPLSADGVFLLQIVENSGMQIIKILKQ